MILNLIGNASYFCASIPDAGGAAAITLFVAGRLVEGMGAAGITLVLVYLISVR